MPAVELKPVKWQLKQKAVYWAPKNPTNSPYNEKVYEEPIEIKCRWDDSVNLTIEKDGKPITVKVEIMVDRRLKIEGVLWLGKLDEITDIMNPYKIIDPENPPARILAKKETPTVSAKRCLYRVYA